MPAKGSRRFHPVGADDDPEIARRRVADDVDDVAAQQRLAAGQDQEAVGREGRDLVDHLEAGGGVELAAVGEALRAHRRLAAGVEVAVLTGEVAAVGEVPRDDVRPREDAAVEPRTAGTGSSMLTCRSGLWLVEHPLVDLLAAPARVLLDAGLRHRTDEVGDALQARLRARRRSIGPRPPAPRWHPRPRRPSRRPSLPCTISEKGHFLGEDVYALPLPVRSARRATSPAGSRGGSSSIAIR